MIAIALSVRAQEGSRYDRFSPLVKGVLRPSVGVFGLAWDTDLVGSRGESSGKGRGGLGERQGWGQGRRMISLALPPLDLRGYYFISQGSLSPSLEILGIIPKE